MYYGYFCGILAATRPSLSLLLLLLLLPLLLLLLLFLLLLLLQFDLAFLHFLLVVLAHEHERVQGQDAAGHRADVDREHHVVVLGGVSLDELLGVQIG